MSAERLWDSTRSVAVKPTFTLIMDKHSGSQPILFLFPFNTLDKKQTNPTTEVLIYTFKIASSLTFVFID